MEGRAINFSPPVESPNDLLVIDEILLYLYIYIYLKKNQLMNNSNSNINNTKITTIIIVTTILCKTYT